MKFDTLSKSIAEHVYGDQLSDKVDYCGHFIGETVTGIILIDKVETTFDSVTEAKEYIKQEDLRKAVVRELYEDMSTTAIVNLIKEHHDIKITDTLIESYVSLASSKLFSVDPVIHGIRNMNTLDVILEGKIDYVLEDQSVVAISNETQESLNNILTNKPEIVEYMRENKNNFLRIIRETQG